MKTAIVILSDPNSGSEEALGRVFNALAAAYDYKQAGADVIIQFQGAATRWVAELTKEDHIAYELFQAVSDKVDGVSCGCADVFGGTEEAEKNGFALIKGNPVPGTSGLPSFYQLQKDGRQIITF
ncbi:DsrE family protein [Pelagicoccus sp. SDUM812003]|uniref:DsrE family protein n=1 Tax=Pelagicoccus sp. SDUM812003 TaxID=3041267 RepID=UPI00280F68CF|nr:DsrE family protein [Pelagicoccus sp. SDUM812003]MDQ8205510.1 DsrE family protein [Pelagicoccus sp. SDUM812003]